MSELIQSVLQDKRVEERTKESEKRFLAMICTPEINKLFQNTKK